VAGPLPSSFSVSVQARRRACVFDIQLALSPFGLLLAQRLSTEFDLWLARELWQILDNTQVYLSQPERLRPVVLHGEAGGPGEPGDALRDTLSQWDAARTAHDLSGLKVYWLGDALGESLLPPGADMQLVSRFEVLAGSLEARAGARGLERDSIVGDCFRDGVSLAATLISYRPFVLTCLPRGAAEPLMCTYLNRWRIRCAQVDTTRTVDMERDSLVSLIGRTGAGELMWTGLDLAVIHVLLPRAIVMPSPEPGVGELYSEPGGSDEPDSQPADWWQNACSFWYPVAPSGFR
jgi:hypothetical protein